MGFNYRRKSRSKDVFKRLKNIQNATLNVGWFDAKYEDGTPVSTVAMIQEFGAPEKNIPPRPFMRPAKMEHAQEWKELFQKGAKAIHKGSKTEEDVLNELGDRIIADIRSAIMDVHFPPLKEQTLKARRSKGNYSDKPLIDTQKMFDTLEKRVEMKGRKR